MAEASGNKQVLHIPGYRLEKTLGEGAQGKVVKGMREADGLYVAIKVLSAAEDPGFRARFAREAKVLLSIEHPNIVGALDVGKLADGTPYLVLEYVDGKTLSYYIREGVMQEEKALGITRQTAVGLACIHERQLVHRDIKPENLMVTPEGLVKIMDLGLVKSRKSESDLTATGSVFGTFGYMSPEASKDAKDADIRSDIYSLGCTLYQALTQKLPFTERKIGRLSKRLLTEDPQPPKTHRQELSDTVNALVVKMIARERKQRCQTPEELLEDIDLVLDGKMPSPVRVPRRRWWWPFGG